MERECPASGGRSLKKMRESLSQAVLDKCPRCSGNVPKDRVFCPNCLFNVNGVRTSFGIIVRFPHISQLLTDPYKLNPKEEMLATLKLWEMQGKLTREEKDWWIKDIENDPELNGVEELDLTEEVMGAVQEKDQKEGWEPKDVERLGKKEADDFMTKYPDGVIIDG